MYESKKRVRFRPVLIAVTLFASLSLTIGRSATSAPLPGISGNALMEETADTEDVPVPLPHDCDGVAPGDPDACCVFGYIYYNDQTVAGVSIHIESPHGTLDTTTFYGGASSEPYYGASLSAAPLFASPGDVITITASYNDMVSARNWTVQSSGQQVDLGLVAGYQASDAALASINGIDDASRAMLPLAFIENVGQFDERAHFQVRSGNATLYFTHDALWIALIEPAPEITASPDVSQQDEVPSRKGANLKLSFVGSNPHPRIEPFDRLDTRISFFSGNDPDKWHTDVPAWGGVRYIDLYPGVDLEITSQDGQLVQRLVVRDDGTAWQLANVRLQVEGVDSLALDGNHLRLTTPLGGVVLPLPSVEGDVPEAQPAISVVDGVYQVSTPFALESVLTVRTAPTSTSAVLYSTYLGGSGEDRAYDIALDNTGNVYITGQTSSADFPTTPGVYDTSYSGDPIDVFVMKLSADGNALVYSTYLGGSGEDAGNGIAVDGVGNVYFTGKTYSTDFPTTNDTLDRNLSGGRDAFVVKLNAAGDDLIYSTYLGGSSWDYGRCITVDDAGYAYVGGFTHGSFPITPGGAQESFGGSGDGFAVKLSLDGSTLLYSTYLGGYSWEAIEGIAVDSEGDAYLASGTHSTDFPTTPGAWDRTCDNCQTNVSTDGAVAKLNADGSEFIYSTLIGGADASGGEDFRDVAVDSAGNAYLIGSTSSTDFPTTASALQSGVGGGGVDAVVVKLNPDGSDLLYSTYLGGSGADRGFSIAIDGDGNAYVTGFTASLDFATVDAPQAANAGGYDAFVAKVNDDGSALLYSTYLGGSGDENCYDPPQGRAGIALDGTGGIYLTGFTGSTDFPTTPGAYDSSYNGGTYDAFVTKLRLGDPQPSLLYSTYLGGSGDDIGYDIAVDVQGNAYVTGETSSVDFPTVTGAYDATYSGDPVDVFVTKLDANGSTLLYSTYLGGDSVDSGQHIVVDDMGNAYITGATYSANFPTTDGALDDTLSGGRDGFVAKLNAAGNTLLYSTYLGGNGWDYGFCIAVDDAGNTYVGGFTHGGFPTTPGVLQETHGGLTDSFITKLNADGSALLYSTYLGGSSYEGIAGIAIDGTGSAYVSGNTHSTDFPITPGAWDEICDNCQTNVSTDGFVAKLSSDASALLYSTYLGGSITPSSEGLNSISVDETGNAYVTGVTNDTTFPTTVNAAQPSFGGGPHDAIVAKLNADGSSLLYSTYLGGDGADVGSGIEIDSQGNAYVTGRTASTDFATVTPLQAANGGGYDAFITKLNARGSALLYSSYLGGSGAENFTGSKATTIGDIALSDASNVYLVGTTSSTDFPTTTLAYDTSFNGGTHDVFVTRIGADDCGWSLTGSLTYGRHNHAATLLSDGRVLVVGGMQERITGSPGLTSTEIYSPTSGAWSTSGSLGQGRQGHTATLLPDGRVLVAGGREGYSDSSLASVEIYDPDSGDWQPAASLSVPRHHHTATPLPDGRVLVVGGGVNASAEIYDPASGIWSPTGSLNTPREGHSATLLPDGRVLVIGGYYQGWLATAEVYDPVSGTWSETPLPLSCHGNIHTATLLPDGRVLVVGGSCGSGTLSDAAEIYDPAESTWTATTNLPAVRGNHTATLLPNGRVLVAGGNDGTGSQYNSALIYDPTSGTWNPTDSLIIGRSRHKAILLADGRVLVVAGWGNTTTYLDSAEVFHPCQIWSPVAAFTATPLSGTAPLYVRFTDQSTGAIVSWDWSFGDGGVSGARHPAHLYGNAGTYTVSLMVLGPDGFGTETKIDYITVGASFPEKRTLILVNLQKLEALYSASEADQVISKLSALADRESVRGLIVQVENDTTVAAAYAVWDADPTSTTKANSVAVSIKALIDAKWAICPNLEYLVIVGDDRVIPFRRVPDRTRYPERHYSLVSENSTIGAALRDNMTLTDDYYADAVPIVPHGHGWDGHDLYIPDLGSGRLIETPDEIISQIDTFLANDEIAASDAAVTGYSFVIDGAQAVCDTLSSDGLTTDCVLVSNVWGRDEFISEILGTRHDIVSFNGHANHFIIGTPFGLPGNDEWIPSSDVSSAAADHTRAIFYTIGCHSGLNVPPSNPYEPLDTAQALIQHQVNYIGNTGYGWGYLTSVGLSEQLVLDFTERLVYGQSATLGEAHAVAKQEYYLKDRFFSYYDEKILIESTLYGLPMYRYTTPTGMQSRQRAAMAIEEAQSAELANGLTVNTYSFQFPALLLESTADGDYYAFGGLTGVGEEMPIQPKYTPDVSFPGTKAHGAVFKGGTYTDVVSFDPVIEQVVTETGTLSEPVFSESGWYPPVLHRLSSLERGERLVILLGQFSAVSQTERLYDQLSFDVYYHTSSEDWDAPAILGVRSEFEDNTATVTVNATDPSGVETVVVAYTDGDGVWASIDLGQNGYLWTVSFPVSSDAEFFVQAVDKAGNVAVRDYEGEYFGFGDDLDNNIFFPIVLKDLGLGAGE